MESNLPCSELEKSIKRLEKIIGERESWSDQEAIVPRRNPSCRL